MSKKQQPAEGFISLLVLLVLTLLFFTALQSYYQVHSLEKQARYQASHRQAVYLAESGIEWAAANLQVNPSWSGGQLLLAEGDIQVSVQEGEGEEDDNKKLVIISEAACSLAKEKIKVHLEKVENGSFRWVYYEELYD